MASKRTWATYPASYQAREVAIIADWIAAEESGAIIGPIGAGKSNLLGFLCHRPDVILSYLPQNHRKLAVVLVDLNNIPGNDLSTFYRIILRALYESQAQFMAIQESLANTLETLYRNTARETDPFVSQSALREALIAIQDEDTRLVLVFDPFDRFVQSADPQILDNLRGLRDSFKATLSYLIGIQQELTYLRDRVEMGELYDLLDMHQCWVGGMTTDDAHFVIGNIIGTKSELLNEEEIEHLITLTGGYAALLKAAGLWLVRVLSRPKPAQWCDALLAEASIQHRLHALWQGLTGEEQLIVAELQSLPESSLRYQQFCQQHAKILAQLKDKQIYIFVPDSAEWRIFSPLLVAYIKQLGLINAGKIHHRKIDDVILQGHRNIEDDLTSQDRKLLLFFLNNPRKVLKKDDIVRALWSESEIVEKGVNDARLQKAVSQVRLLLEKGNDGPSYIKTVHGEGYRFFPEGAPRETDLRIQEHFE